MIRIVEGDSRKLLRKVNTGTVDMIYSSPPYNIGKEYEKRVALEQYVDWISPIMDELVRVLKPGGCLVWQVGTYVTGKGKTREVLPLDYVFLPLFETLGLTLRHRFVWHFGHGLHNIHSFSGRHETMLLFSKGALADADAKLEALMPEGDVWKVTNVKHNHPEKTAHPCQFPEGLVAPFVKVLTKPGELLLDPFAGAGTVGAVAKKLGRDALLLELDPDYCRIARHRIAQAAPE